MAIKDEDLGRTVLAESSIMDHGGQEAHLDDARAQIYAEDLRRMLHRLQTKQARSLWPSVAGRKCPLSPGCWSLFKRDQRSSRYERGKEMLGLGEIRVVEEAGAVLKNLGLSIKSGARYMSVS